MTVPSAIFLEAQIKVWTGIVLLSIGLYYFDGPLVHRIAANVLMHSTGGSHKYSTEPPNRPGAPANTCMHACLAWSAQCNARSKCLGEGRTCGGADGGEVAVLGVVAEEAAPLARHLQPPPPPEHRRHRPAMTSSRMTSAPHGITNL